jgi:hypothetical protein
LKLIPIIPVLQMTWSTEDNIPLPGTRQLEVKFCRSSRSTINSLHGWMPNMEVTKLVTLQQHEERLMNM